MKKQIEVLYVESVVEYQMYKLPTGIIMNLGGRGLPF